MYFIRNGESEFSIVIGKNASETIVHAAKELQLFLKEAMGTELAIKEECDGYVIRLCSFDGTEDEFSIATDTDGYTITGDSDRAVVYGVYAFLQKILDLVFYTHKDYEIRHTQNLAFEKIDCCYKPDISARAIGIAPYHDEQTNAPFLPHVWRMGARGMAENWGVCGHTYFKILPPEIYKEKHPDWYSENGGGTLCLSNEEMREEFVKNLIRIVDENPYAKYFMLGQQDLQPPCSCKNCRKAVEKHGGFESGLMLEFVNEVTKRVNAYVKKTDRKRELVIGTFAYLYSLMPPAVKANGVWQSTFVGDLEENVALMIAPLSARGDISYFHPDNTVCFGTCKDGLDSTPLKDIFDGWHTLIKRFCVWAYCIDYADSLAPFDHWDTLEENYKNYKGIGCEYLFEEGTYNRYIPNFNHLRCYLISRLSWKTDLNVQEEINRFMLGYFGEECAPYARAYFDFLNSICKKIEKNGRPMLYVKFDDYSYIATPENWKFADLKEAQRLHDIALSHAHGKYKERMNEEGFPIWIMLLMLYNTYYSKEARSDMAKKVMDIATKYGINSGECEGVQSWYFDKIKKFILE